MKFDKLTYEAEFLKVLASDMPEREKKGRLCVLSVNAAYANDRRSK